MKRKQIETKKKMLNINKNKKREKMQPNGNGNNFVYNPSALTYKLFCCFIIFSFVCRLLQYGNGEITNWVVVLRSFTRILNALYVSSK